MVAQQKKNTILAVKGNCFSFLKMHWFLVVLLCFLLGSCTSPSKPKQPNFLIILIDDLGKEWISAYGASEINTPNIDLLAASGIKFNRAYSMPQCTPSRVALVTGQYPYTNGWINHYDVPRWGHGVNFDTQKNPAFANELKKAGYKTCVAGKWQINDFRIEPDAMQKAGFDEFCMWTGYESSNPISESRYWDPYIHTKEGSKTYHGQFGPDIFSDFIIDFLRENKEHPMCVYYPMVLTHTPFVHTPFEPGVTTIFEKHRAMVRYTDHIIGKIVEALEEMDIMDNTYLILTTDNGTTSSIIGKRDTAYVRGGKTFLSENGINAPFIARTPNGKTGETEALVDFTDIYPTLLDLANIENRNLLNIDGVSFADVLRGNLNNGKREWALSMGGLPAVLSADTLLQNRFVFRDRVICSQHYKAYVDTLKQVVRIFDMQEDPYETNNLIDEANVKDELARFNTILELIPERDNNPVYTRIQNSGGDIPLTQLQNLVRRRDRSNLLPLANEEAFLKLKNSNK
ncbi:sulfatase-like hydrolase/transferase [uncultured Draconibacterium sp.]|uniref:sulfatase-like hydrolase/transferase n=1 Tax=uncultured Draconibacterium sp. TaxID=1573823 RepID=UPI0026004927|nr:sulfatase-like hydrolase/transferase [uncultured Draconibacterium sp.]